MGKRKKLKIKGFEFLHLDFIWKKNKNPFKNCKGVKKNG